MATGNLPCGRRPTIPTLSHLGAQLTNSRLTSFFFSRQGQGQGGERGIINGTRKSTNATAHATESTSTKSTWQSVPVISDIKCQLSQHPTPSPGCKQFTTKSNFSSESSTGSAPATKPCNTDAKSSTGTTPTAEFPGPDGQRPFPGCTKG